MKEITKMIKRDYEYGKWNTIDRIDEFLYHTSSESLKELNKPFLIENRSV